MAPRKRTKPQQPKRKPARRSWWSELERLAEGAHLSGHRQWALLRFLARLGNTKNATRNIMRGRRQLAELLGLDTGTAAWVYPDGQQPERAADDLVHDLGGRNTRRRLARLQALGLVWIVGPVCVRGGCIVPSNGGRMPGCGRGTHLRGRAIRIYPGERLWPPALRCKQIEIDNLADAGLIDWARVKPVADLTPVELDELEELGRTALQTRGP